ncbi:acyl-CoA carboxylase subunit epsilon [Streptomyces sp. NPDC054833]
MTTTRDTTTPALHLTVVRGEPDPEDLAALIAVLIGGEHSTPEPLDPAPLRAGWDRTHQEGCLPAGSWRARR